MHLLMSQETSGVGKTCHSSNCLHRTKALTRPLAPRLKPSYSFTHNMHSMPDRGPFEENSTVSYQVGTYTFQSKIIYFVSFTALVICEKFCMTVNFFLTSLLCARALHSLQFSCSLLHKTSIVDKGMQTADLQGRPSIGPQIFEIIFKNISPCSLIFMRLFFYRANVISHYKKGFELC